MCWLGKSLEMASVEIVILLLWCCYCLDIYLHLEFLWKVHIKNILSIHKKIFLKNIWVVFNQTEVNCQLMSVHEYFFFIFVRIFFLILCQNTFPTHLFCLEEESGIYFIIGWFLHYLLYHKDSMPNISLLGIFSADSGYSISISNWNVCVCVRARMSTLRMLQKNSYHFVIQ